MGAGVSGVGGNGTVQLAGTYTKMTKKSLTQVNLYTNLIHGTTSIKHTTLFFDLA